MNRRLIFLLTICACMLCTSVKAHGGHTHIGLNAELKDKYKNKKISINVGDLHVGHFYIKSIRGKGARKTLVLEQTLHLNAGDYSKKVRASFNKQNLLRYTFKTEDETQVYMIDLNDHSGGTNSGYRIVTSTIADTNGRAMTADELVVTFPASGNDSNHHHGEMGHTKEAHMHP